MNLVGSILSCHTLIFRYFEKEIIISYCCFLFVRFSWSKLCRRFLELLYRYEVGMHWIPGRIIRPFLYSVSAGYGCRIWLPDIRQYTGHQYSRISGQLGSSSIKETRNLLLRENANIRFFSVKYK